MTDDSYLLDPKHWRDLADETLAKARQASDPRVRERLLKVAQEYERVAKRAEQWCSAGKMKGSDSRS